MTIHLRRRQIFTNFWPLPPYRRQVFSTIHRQILQIFDPSPPKTCRRLKWMVRIEDDERRSLPSKLAKILSISFASIDFINFTHCFCCLIFDCLNLNNKPISYKLFSISIQQHLYFFALKILNYGIPIRFFPVLQTKSCPHSTFTWMVASWSNLVTFEHYWNFPILCVFSESVLTFELNNMVIGYTCLLIC